MIILSKEPSDKPQPKAQRNFTDPESRIMKDGDKPEKVSADSGYFSETNMDYLEAEGIKSFIATGRQKHGDIPATAGRGLENVSAEWDLICLTHNLLKLFRSGLMAERA